MSQCTLMALDDTVGEEDVLRVLRCGATSSIWSVHLALGPSHDDCHSHLHYQLGLIGDPACELHVCDLAGTVSNLVMAISELVSAAPVAISLSQCMCLEVLRFLHPMRTLRDHC